jgi:hypothetical protein
MIDRRGFIVGTAAVAATAALPSPAFSGPVLSAEREFVGLDMNISLARLHRAVMQQLKMTESDTYFSNDVYLAITHDPGLSREEQRGQRDRFMEIAEGMPPSAFRDECLSRLRKSLKWRAFFDAQLAKIDEARAISERRMKKEIKQYRIHRIEQARKRTREHDHLSTNRYSPKPSIDHVPSGA